MGRRRKEITNNIRILIFFHNSSGKTIRNNAKLVNLTHFTVQYVIKCFKNPRLSTVKVFAEFNEKFSTSE